jgi:hypothetical protein
LGGEEPVKIEKAPSSASGMPKESTESYNKNDESKEQLLNKDSKSIKSPKKVARFEDEVEMVEA